MQLKVLVIGATGGQTVKQLEVLQLKWRQFEREVILLAVGWYLRTGRQPVRLGNRKVWRSYPPNPAGSSYAPKAAPG